jgi:nucleoside-diphosphate-sugar epimerase
LRGEPPKLSSGTYKADWVYVDDVIDGFIQAATRTGIDGAVIDLGTGSLTSLRDVVNTIVRIIEPTIEPQFGALSDRPGQAPRIADVDYARQTLDWTATTSLSDGLAATVAWHRAQLKATDSKLPLPLGEGRGEGALNRHTERPLTISS